MQFALLRSLAMQITADSCGWIMLHCCC